MIRCAIYCRVSTADQDCQRQEHDLIDYAANAGYQIEGIYKETASGAKCDRVERAKVLAIAQKRKIDAVLVTELTRWGRDTLDLIHSLHDLQSWGVSLIAQTGMQFDLSTPHGKMMAGLMAVLAEFERDLIRERIKSGVAAAKARGEKLGRPSVPLELQQRVLTAKAQGLSFTQIAKETGISRTKCFEIVKVNKMSPIKLPNSEQVT